MIHEFNSVSDLFRADGIKETIGNDVHDEHLTSKSHEENRTSEFVLDRAFLDQK